MDRDVLLVMMPVSAINDCTLQSGTAGKNHWSISGEFYQCGPEINASVKCILQRTLNNLLNNVIHIKKKEKENLNKDVYHMTLKVWIGQVSFYRSVIHFLNNIPHHFKELIGEKICKAAKSYQNSSQTHKSHHERGITWPQGRLFFVFSPTTPTRSSTCCFLAFQSFLCSDFRCLSISLSLSVFLRAHAESLPADY